MISHPPARFHLPLVSVIVPTHNGAATIEQALESIRLQEVPHEIIVVNDGSTDETPQMLACIEHLRVVHRANGGPAAARNSALPLALAPYVAFLDDDDAWVAGKLAAQITVLENDPAALATIGRSTFVGSTIPSSATESIFEPRLLFSLGAALIRREAFERVGFFDEALPGSEDVDWFLRLRDGGGALIMTEDVVQFVRRNGENITRGRDLQSLAFHAVVRRSVARRRGELG